jgi:hypothetical protein
VRLVGHCREPLPARGFVLADADAEKDRLITGRSVRPVIGFAVSTAWVLRHVAQQFAGPAFGPPAANLYVCFRRSTPPTARSSSPARDSSAYQITFVKMRFAESMKSGTSNVECDVANNE